MLPSHTKTETGFTLLEIMVVLVILSMLLGIGIGAFSKVGSGPSLALGVIKDTLRAARFHALREKAPSAVLIHGETGYLVGMGWKNVGCWHFEDDEAGLSTGFPTDASFSDCSLNPDGVIGSCLDVPPGSGGGDAAVLIPSSPSLDSVRGVALQAFIQLRSRGIGILVAKGETYCLSTDETGRLFISLKLQSAQHPSGAEIVLDSGSYVLPLGRWVSVAFQFTGFSTLLWAEGVQRAREDYPEPRLLFPHDGAPIRIMEFDGLLDEIRLSAAVRGEDRHLHESIHLIGGFQTIHFDARGRLDRAFHTGPAAVEFVYNENKRYRIEVGLLGEVQ